MRIWKKNNRNKARFNCNQGFDYSSEEKEFLAYLHSLSYWKKGTSYKGVPLEYDRDAVQTWYETSTDQAKYKSLFNEDH